jgi:hypothetical protein
VSNATLANLTTTASLPNLSVANSTASPTQVVDKRGMLPLATFLWRRLETVVFGSWTDLLLSEDRWGTLNSSAILEAVTNFLWVRSSSILARRRILTTTACGTQ